MGPQTRKYISYFGKAFLCFLLSGVLSIFGWNSETVVRWMASSQIFEGFSMIPVDTMSFHYYFLWLSMIFCYAGAFFVARSTIKVLREFDNMVLLYRSAAHEVKNKKNEADEKFKQAKNLHDKTVSLMKKWRRQKEDLE